MVSDSLLRGGRANDRSSVAEWLARALRRPSRNHVMRNTEGTQKPQESWRSRDHDQTNEPGDVPAEPPSIRLAADEPMPKTEQTRVAQMLENR
jgi:hypothetical protein